VDERLLWTAAGTRVVLDCTLIHHDRETEARMRFRFCHDGGRGLIHSIIRSIPVDNDSIDASADHVQNLFSDLLGIGRVIADIHVVRPAKPQHQVSEYLSVSARIEQRMHIELAYIALTQVAVGLAGKTICSTGVVRGLCRQRCGRLNL